MPKLERSAEKSRDTPRERRFGDERRSHCDIPHSASRTLRIRCSSTMGTSYPATLVANWDSLTGLSYLSIAASNLPSISFGDPDGIRAGNRLFLIANTSEEYRTVIRLDWWAIRDKTFNIAEEQSLRRSDGRACMRLMRRRLLPISAVRRLIIRAISWVSWAMRRAMASSRRFCFREAVKSVA